MTQTKTIPLSQQEKIIKVLQVITNTPLKPKKLIQKQTGLTTWQITTALRQMKKEDLLLIERIYTKGSRREIRTYYGSK